MLNGTASALTPLVAFSSILLVTAVSGLVPRRARQLRVEEASKKRSASPPETLSKATTSCPSPSC